MKFAALLVATCLHAGTAVAAESTSAPASAPASAPDSAPAPAPASATAAAALAGSTAPPTMPVLTAPSLPMPTSTGTLLKTVLALSFVLALVAVLAWLMRRYGMKANGANTTLRLVGSLSLGGRERILVVEVADQWIVVGAAPGRVNALATIPRHETGTPADASVTLTQDAPTTNFAHWLTQTIANRNGK